MFCCTLLYVHSSIAIILMGKRELIALFNLSSWCLVMVERLFLAVPRGCLQFVIVVFPDHTHLLFLVYIFLTYMDSLYVEMVSLQRPQPVKMLIPTLTEYKIYNRKLGYHAIKRNAHTIS